MNEDIELIKKDKEIIEFTLQKIKVLGFKSLKDIEITFNKQEPLVLVGTNGSGKTNLIELFLFLRRALYDELRRRPYAPHAEWGNPRNITWEASGKPIRVELEFKLYKKEYNKLFNDKIKYTVIFAPDEAFTTIKPIIEEITIEKLGYNLRRVVNRFETKIRVSGNSENMHHEIKNCIDDNISINCNDEWCRTTSYVTNSNDDVPLVLIAPNIFSFELKCENKIRVSEIIFTDWSHISIPFPENEYKVSISLILRLLRTWFRKIIILKQIDYNTAKWPHNRYSDDIIKPRGENLAEVLYRILQSSEGRERVEAAMVTLFPWLEVRVEFNEYGQIGLVFYEKKGDKRIQLYPSMIPDGVIKMLAILAAISLKPSLLAIDEIENSLHAAILDYIFSEIEDLNVPTIIATHSPLVVDLAGPKRTLLLRRSDDGSTIVEKLASEELWRKMQEEGISLGEYYTYASR